MQAPVPPKTIDDALNQLVKNGKLVALPVGNVDRMTAVTNASKEWYRLFFEHPFIQGYIADRVITRWAQVQTTVRS
jgi:hypothetical protein